MNKIINLGNIALGVRFTLKSIIQIQKKLGLPFGKIGTVLEDADKVLDILHIGIDKSVHPEYEDKECFCKMIDEVPAHEYGGIVTELAEALFGKPKEQEGKSVAAGTGNQPSEPQLDASSIPNHSGISL